MIAALQIAYDGTDFSGWQVQKNKNTVQGEIEQAIAAAFGFSARVTGSGRTDAGVHAAGQICSFEMRDEIQIHPARIADALNVFLPPAVRVLSSVRAPDGFDACRAAKRKTYRYRIYFSRRENPLWERYAARAAGPFDQALALQCASVLEGEHDFRCFSSTGSSVKTTIRRLYSVTMEAWTDGFVRGTDLVVCGNGFLYNMVRILAGAILGCAQGRLTVCDVEAALAGGGRDLLGKTLPAKGLTLLQVDYGFPLFE